MTPHPPAGDSPVEAYLDDLLRSLSGHPRQIRYQLAEADDHLRQSTDEGVARGIPRDRAEAEAVARFGPARLLAAAESRRQRPSIADIAVGGAVSGWWLGALGAVAVGVSGVLAALGTAIWGQTFTAGRPAPSVLTAASCARWTANIHAASCAQAATADWASDTAVFRIALGILGAVALATLVWWRRRRGGGRLSRPLGGGLPAEVVDAVAITCSGAAGVWLAGKGIDTVIVTSGRGAGQWLSAAPVALGLAAVFARRLWRNLRSAPAWAPSVATG